MVVAIIGSDVYVAGEKLPPIPHLKNGISMKTVGTTIFVNGYEYKRGRWKRTLPALWHYIFG